MSFQITTPLPLPLHSTNIVPPSASRLKPKALPSVGRFAINPHIGASHTMAFNFRHHGAALPLTRNQLQQAATYPLTQDLVIRIMNYEYTVSPLDERFGFVESNEGVTNEDVIRAVRERVDFEDRELEELGVCSFGRSLYRRIWGGLGRPDADGVCALRLLRAV